MSVVTGPKYNRLWDMTTRLYQMHDIMEAILAEIGEDPIYHHMRLRLRKVQPWINLAIAFENNRLAEPYEDDA